MVFEHTSEPLLPRALWLKRVYRSVSLAGVIIIAALCTGIAGYHFLGHLGLVDSILEASMILGGMGPVSTMSNDAVKLFASAYALFSGLIVLSVSGIIVAPWLHRLIHIVHQPKSTKK